jgi:large subunit ribosomal protein L10e
VSNKWGFTKLTRLDYLKRSAEGTIINDGSDVKIVRTKGPLINSPLFIDPKSEDKKKRK